jgi:hypothetical protein
MIKQTPTTIPENIDERRNTRQEMLQLLAALAIGKFVVLLTIFLCDPTPNFLHTLSTKWDSIIFQTIATQGYTQASYYAFSPFYPALITGLDYITRHAWVSGLIITNVISFIFPLVLHRTFGFKTALLAILFPTYLVFTTIPYSDVIVLLFLALSLFFVMREKIIASSAMVSLAIMNAFRQAWMLPAYAFIALKSKRIRDLAFFIIPALTGILILLWFDWRTGDFLSYFSLEKDTWGVHFTDPLSQIEWLRNGWFTTQTWTVFGLQLPPVYWIVRNLLFEGFYLVGAFYLLRTANKNRIFLFLFSLSAIIPLLFVAGTPAISIPRLLLPAFPVFLGYATLLKKEWHYWLYGIVCLVLTTWVSISQIYSFFA